MDKLEIFRLRIFFVAIGAMENRVTPVIIDNTNCHAWEMRRYVLAAINHGYEVYLLEPDTPWKFSAKELARFVLSF